MALKQSVSKMKADGASSTMVVSDQHNFEYMFKLLLIGNSSVGKTSFLFQYADNAFTSNFVSTVGIDFKVKTIIRQNKKIRLQIWDTAGQERYRTITTAYYRGAMGFLLMYDITNEDSFNAVQDWIYQIKIHSCSNVPIVIVGNKTDQSNRKVSTSQGQGLASSLGLEFFESSAKDNVNVKTAIEHLVDLILEKMSESPDADPALLNAAKPTRIADPLGKGGCAC